ncbi:L-fucose:H+ symporter permease [Hufsiella ginkgonis]|uniref:L-fucose:H+ symporter permease n=1 Tax=Hufsiella ginkgonis TaxID=2695274 RepID=A0A7K1XW55_9SPHI|nr:L-fucose:H+ symporter permease [Hufsiella ginkgonis]MXV15225.1 L-fucose:H+ symporter permease [Hufsiella ginkgonis]
MKASNNVYLVPFILVTSLFFLWGMVHNLDGILIPHLKKACQLNNRQSTLVDTAIFLAYFIMAIPAGLLLKKWGYKISIVTGLVIAAAGAALFVPAANQRAYEMFLGALFIIGCGIAILETAANPYTEALGAPETATIRMNLAASFNGLAAAVAPIVGSIFIFSGKNYTTERLQAMSDATRNDYLFTEAASVKLPYLVLSGALLLVALLFYLTRIPEIKPAEDLAVPKGNLFSVLRNKHVSWAVVAQFFYVGAQVCVTSFFIRMAEQGAGMDEKTAAWYLSVYGTLFMTGRFAGTFLLRFTTPQRLLFIYALASIVLCAIAILGDGAYVIYALGGLGFFMSIMFPTIFSLGIKGLNEDAKPASSWLIMAIVGGAVLPYLMGTMIDLNHDLIQPGYTIPLICYAVILFFAWRGYKVKTV